MTYMYVDCEREVGDSLSSPHVPMYMYMHIIIIARKHSICAITCTSISIHRKHSIDKLIHQDQRHRLLCLHKMIKIYTDQRFHVLRNKHVRILTIDSKQHNTSYVNTLQGQTIDRTATDAGEGDHSIHTQSWCLDTDWGWSNCGATLVIPTHVQYLEPGRHGWYQLLVKWGLSANIQTVKSISKSWP